jgi:hypothetical protein
MIVLKCDVGVPRYFSLLFALMQKVAKKSRLLRKSLKSTTSSGDRPKLLTVLKMTTSGFDILKRVWTFLKLLVKQGSLFALRCWDFYGFSQRPSAPT